MYALKSRLALHLVIFAFHLVSRCQCDSDHHCLCPQYLDNVSSIVEQYCRSEFMIKINVISPPIFIDNATDEFDVYYEFELVKYVKISGNAREALHTTHRLYTSSKECGRNLKKNKRYLVSGELTQDNTKGATTICKYIVPKEKLTKFDEAFFRIKHAKEKCIKYKEADKIPLHA